MQSLYHYIANTNITKPLEPMLDCHVHLFDDKGPVVPIPKSGGVGFADYSIVDIEKYKDGKMMDMYDKWTNTSLYELTTSYTLLATSPDPHEACDILRKYNLPGFGEIKCYNEFLGEKHTIKGLGMKNKEYWGELFSYAHMYRNPVWIHWALITPQDVEDFEDILSTYPNVKFVLCHCGVGNPEEYDKYSTVSIFRAHPYDSLCYACKLAKTYDNCYLDISWTVSKLLINGCELATSEAMYAMIPQTKLIVGSDLNPNVCRRHPDEAKSLRDDYDKIWKKCGNYVSSNLLRIFDNTPLQPIYV